MTDPAAAPLATVSDTLNFNTTPGSVNSSTLYLNGTRGTSAPLVATMNFSTGSATTTTLLGGVSGVAANNNLFISHLTVNAGSGAVTIGDTAASPTAKVDLKAGSISITNNSSSLLTLANGLNSYGTGSTTTFTFTGSGNILSGGVIGNGTSTNVVALTKTGNGILTLKGANTYSSTTTLTAGTIQIGVGNVGSVGSITSSAIGKGTLSLNGGTISSDGTTARTILNAVTYSNASTFGNATNNGKLTFSAAVNLGTAQKTMTVNSDVQFDGILSGALGGISLGTSTGFGKLTLTNTSNSFTGAVGFAANSGTLRITSSGALGVGPKTVSNTAASGSVPGTGANLLELDSNGGADISLASNISFTTSGSAGVVLNTAGNNTIAGDFNMTSGNGNTKIISNGGTLTLTGQFTGNATDRQLDLAGSTTGNIFSGKLVNGTGNTAWLTKSGAGTWTVSGGLNTFTGPTKVTGGTLKLTNNLAIQNSAFDTSGAGALNLTDAAITTLTIGGLIGDAGTGQNLVFASNVTTLTLNPTVAATTNTYVKNFSGGTAGLTLTKTGAGTQVLSGTNSYSGDTAINAGSLQIESAGALGSSANIAVSALNSSALVLKNVTAGSGQALTISGQGVGGYYGALSTPTSGNTSSEWQGSVTIGATTLTRIGSQSGLLKVSGDIGQAAAGSTLTIRNADAAGTTLFTGNNNYTGGTFLYKGYLQLGSANAIGTGVGTLSFGGGFLSSDGATARTIANPVAFTASATLGDAANAGKLTFSNTTDLGTAVRTLTLASDAEFSGVISNTGGITKVGAGILTLSNTVNSYTGVTTFQTGIVNAAVLSDYGVDGSLGNRAADGATNVGLHFTGGTLQYTGSSAQSTNRSIRVGTAGGTIDASGSSPSATMSFTKTTANVDFFNTAGTRTLTLTGSNTGDNLFAINIQDQATGTRTSLAKTGSGTWLLTNANNSAAFSATTNTFGGYGGGTTISGGTLAFANDAIGGGVVNFTGNSTLRWESGNTQDITTGTGSGVARSVKIDDGVTATFNTNGNDVILSNALGVGTLATGAVTKTGAGKLTLSATNTYTGETTVTAGILALSGTGSLATGSDVTVEIGATLDVAGTVNGLLTVDDGGTLTGNLGTFNSSVTINGIHNPGNSPGLQTFTNGLAYGSTGVLNAEFVGDTLGIRGTDFDGVDVTGGNLSINSLATFNLIAATTNYALAVWDSARSFTVIDYSGGGTSSGIFAFNTSGAGSFASQGSWSLANTSGDVVLSWAPIPEPSIAVLTALGACGFAFRRRRSA